MADDSTNVQLANIQGDVKLVLSHVEGLRLDLTEVRRTVGEQGKTIGDHAIAIARFQAVSETTSQSNIRWRDWLLPVLSLLVAAAAVLVTFIGG